MKGSPFAFSRSIFWHLDIGSRIDHSTKIWSDPDAVNSIPRPMDRRIEVERIQASKTGHASFNGKNVLGWTKPVTQFVLTLWIPSRKSWRMLKMSEAGPKSSMSLDQKLYLHSYSPTFAVPLTAIPPLGVSAQISYFVPESSISRPQSFNGSFAYNGARLRYSMLFINLPLLPLPMWLFSMVVRRVNVNGP